MSDYEFGMILNQGYHLDTDAGYYVSGKQMGRAEAEEEYRAERIDVFIVECQRI